MRSLSRVVISAGEVSVSSPLQFRIYKIETSFISPENLVKYGYILDRLKSAKYG